eukprot:2589425-Pyramimonas_sp.AAC.2
MTVRCWRTVSCSRAFHSAAITAKASRGPVWTRDPSNLKRAARISVAGSGRRSLARTNASETWDVSSQ